jgi:hypothetical protein
MADTNSNGVPNEVIVERNSVKLPFKPNKYKRGAKEGSIFFAPEVEAKGDTVSVTLPASLASVVAWLGAQTLADWLQAKLNLTSQSATEEASCKVKLDSSGKPVKNAQDEYEYEDTDFRIEDFTKMMSELSTRGESKAELEEKQSELIDKLEAIAQKKDGTPEENMAQFAFLVKELSTVKHAIAAKARTRKSKIAEPVAA